jgi:prevent-host-death family protein
MLIDTENLVSADEFQQHFERYLAAASAGNGPVAITRGSQVVGVLLAAEEYDALFGTAVRKLLKSRETGPTVSHEEVRRRAKQVIQKRAAARRSRS